MRVAAVDIGTNTVRLLIARRDEKGLFVPEQRLATVTRLGRGVDAQGRLDPGAISHSIAVLDGYRKIIEAVGVDAVGGVATSAVRDAADREVFLDSAERALGTRPRLISGDEEARLSFRGVITGMTVVTPLLVIDPGGGSTEFVLGEMRPDYAISVDTGSVRLTEHHLLSRPPPARALDAARREVDALLEAVVLPAIPGTVVGVGGTFTSLAAILLDLPEYGATRIHGASFPTAQFDAIADRLATLTAADTASIPSLHPDRAPVLLCSR
jgi:exopolyphosphatase/guanosine-5'-triphosphate,3'-diphosphate pyrophosphatase